MWIANGDGVVIFGDDFVEQRFGDVTGTGFASAFAEYNDAMKLSAKWFFQLDPDDVGLNGHWEKLPTREWKKWSRISIMTGWGKAEEWQTPFAIRIDEKLNRKHDYHSVLARVKGESKTSGIRHRAMLLCK